MSIHAEPPPAVVTEPHGVSYATAQQLGKGGFAICHKAERLDAGKLTGHLVALKIVKSKMDPPKLAQKVNIKDICLRSSDTDRIQVHHRVADPFETLTSKHCRLPQSIFILRKYLRCIGIVFIRIAGRLVEEEEMLDYARNSKIDDSGLWRRKVFAHAQHCTPRP